MAATKAQFLESYLFNMMKSHTALKEGALRLVSKHQKGRDRMNTFNDKVKAMAAVEIIEEVKQALNNVSVQLANLEEEHRKRMIARIEREFKARADSFLPKLETQKMLLTARNKTFQDQADKEKYLQKQKSKPNPKREKLAKAQTDVTNASQALTKVEADVNNSFTAFQYERTAAVRKMFEEFVTSEIYYHARAIENLTAAYQLLPKIDPEQVATSMRQVLNHYDSPNEHPLPNTPAARFGRTSMTSTATAAAAAAGPAAAASTPAATPLSPASSVASPAAASATGPPRDQR